MLNTFSVANYKRSNNKFWKTFARCFFSHQKLFTKRSNDQHIEVRREQIDTFMEVGCTWGSWEWITSLCFDMGEMVAPLLWLWTIRCNLTIETWTIWRAKYKILLHFGSHDAVGAFITLGGRLVCPITNITMSLEIQRFFSLQNELQSLGSMIRWSAQVGKQKPEKPFAVCFFSDFKTVHAWDTRELSLTALLTVFNFVQQPFFVDTKSLPVNQQQNGKI